MKSNRKLLAFLAGIVLILFAIFFSLFLTNSKNGHDIDFSSLPIQAQILLEENKGNPITPEIWAKLNEILKSEKWDSGVSPMLLDLKSGWFWFLLFPFLGVLLYKIAYKKIFYSEAALIMLPSIVAYGFFLLSI